MVSANAHSARRKKTLLSKNKTKRQWPPPRETRELYRINRLHLFRHLLVGHSLPGTLDRRSRHDHHARPGGLEDAVRSDELEEGVDPLRLARDFNDDAVV